ncbi:hypothetical protein DFP72DRAFT_901673 [Ephemerocybe angulata]|uniref:Inhibitor I9 domain-containing protein n=1 Tax=Ephemerocybe angulata TaxID=980116 RepID=A0A8H6HUG8_9AGAR|nr:hypothetical protein DFP72DRAFT_901673 [Tulosesus angulatus]
MADSVPVINLAGLTPVEEKEKSYIVHLQTGVDKEAHFRALRLHLHGTSDIKDDYKLRDMYSGTFDEETLDFLRASPDVERIEEDVLSSIFG